MKTCVVESPYAGDVARNTVYLERCILWCAQNGFAPYASHKMMTTALDDNNPDQRMLGVSCGYAFRRLVHTRFFFLDYGMSTSMRAARELYEFEGLNWCGIEIGVNP